jgi:hypothetical protein
MGQFDSLSVPEISVLISELEETRRIKQGAMPKSTLRKYLDIHGPDFMGTGMSFQEFMAVGEIERLNNAYWRQSREEKDRRRDAVVALACEYAKITQQTNQAIAWAREAIPEVLNGGWKDVRMFRDMLTFTGEEKSFRDRYVPIFEHFVSLLDQVLEGVPKVEPEVQRLETPS